MHSAGSEEWPNVDVIVAVRNEAALIVDKLRELDAIDYPPDRLRIVIVDGGSSDATVAAISSNAGRDARWLPVVTALASKTAQLNEALDRTTAPWVLVTHADARVPPQTLRRLVEEVARDPRVGVVGTSVVLHRPHPLDHLHAP